jgi:chaperonin cofactor prefoldin
MKRRLPTPSARLLRAVAAERSDLRRQRDELLAQRQRVQDQLDEIDAAMAQLDERIILIDRLAGEPRPTGASGAPAPSPPDEPGRRLRGPAIRAAAVQVLLGQPQRPEALHYRDWFGLMGEAGFLIEGKDPLAVFLTQLSRSPVVRRGTQSGIYELDPTAPARMRRQLEDLHTQLRGLTATSSATTDLPAIRGQRTTLTAQISKTERALEEAEAVLRDSSDASGLAAAG